MVSERGEEAANSESARGAAGVRGARPFPFGRRPTGVVTKSGQSGRLARGHRSSLSLIARLVVPLTLLLAISAFCQMLSVRNLLHDLRLEEIRDETAAAALAAAAVGRVILHSRGLFMREHPEYVAASEWRTGEHWLVANRLVEPERMVEAAGFGLDESAPVASLEEVAGPALLSGLIHSPPFRNRQATLISATLLHADGSPLASAANRDFPQRAWSPASLPRRGEAAAAGPYRLFFGTGSRLAAGPVWLCLVDVMSLEDPEVRLGSVLSTFLIDGHNGDAARLTLVQLAVLTAQLAGAVLICWLAARRQRLALGRVADDLRAIADGDFSRRSEPTGSAEADLVSQAFNSMSERLRAARTNERENVRLESDLAAARNVQACLLPSRTLGVQGLDVHCDYRPAREVGGDYYDFLPVDTRHMGLVVADVSGKSVPAALIMAAARAVFHFVAPGNASPAQTLSQVNAVLAADMPKGMFVTACYMIIDPRERTLLYASAGHTPLLVARRDGQVEQPPPGGIALGFDPGPVFLNSIREERVVLAPGDRVLAYTDGVTECLNPAQEEYSERRLREFLRRNRDLSSRDFVDALMTDLERHRGEAETRDDVTVVTFLMTE